MSALAPPEQGQLVDVRQRRFVVTEVRRASLPADALRDSQRNGLWPIVHSALLGAPACALQAPRHDTQQHTVAATAPQPRPENGAACLERYRLVEAQHALQAA